MEQEIKLLKKQVADLTKTVKDNNNYISLLKQDVQLYDRGQLAFPLTANTNDLIFQSIQENEEFTDYWNYLFQLNIFTVFSSVFASGLDNISGGTVTVVNPNLDTGVAFQFWVEGGTDTNTLLPIPTPSVTLYDDTVTGQITITFDNPDFTGLLHWFSYNIANI